MVENSRQGEPPESQTFKDKPRRRTLAALLAGSLTVAAAVGGVVWYRTGTCASPWEDSRVYPGDPSAVPGDQSTWDKAAEISADPPPGIRGVRFAYKPPGVLEWVDISDPVPANRADRVAMAIGRESVIFGAQTVDERGSPACDNAPRVTFSDPEVPRSYKVLVEQQGATVPSFS